MTTPDLLNQKEWFAELRRLTAAEGVPNYIDQTGEEPWLEAFHDGSSPAEAWETEKAYGYEGDE